MVKEWCKLLQDMIDSSRTNASFAASFEAFPDHNANDPNDSNYTDNQVNPSMTSITSITSIPSNDLENGHESHDISITNPSISNVMSHPSDDSIGFPNLTQQSSISLNQPYNPFYGIPTSNSVHSAHSMESHNEPLPIHRDSASNNPYYSAPVLIHQNTNNNNADIASAPSVEDIEPDNPGTDPLETKVDEFPKDFPPQINNQFPSLDINHAVDNNTQIIQNKNKENVAFNQFQLASTLSLQSSLLKSWMSFNPITRSLCAVTTAPMVNERFIFQCIDPLHHIYTIQSPQSPKCPHSLFLSAMRDGEIQFVPSMKGIYEQWKVQYHDINQISITSLYDNTHFGIDSNGLFHHKYPSITSIVQFTVSPPVQLSQPQHQRESDIHSIISWPKLDGMCIALKCCIGDGHHLGVEHRDSKSVSTQYTTCQSFDGALLVRSTFEVHQDGKWQLFAFKSVLNGKWLSPSKNGTICFVDTLSESEYFSVIWHDVHILSLMTYLGTLWKVNKKNTLFHEGYDWRSPHCAFEVISKQFERQNRDLSNVPSPQLPIRKVDGNMKRDIWLKGRVENAGYLAFRSKPYRYEAVSQMMGKWETIRFQHDATRNNGDHRCVVRLFTDNGMVIGCDGGAQIVFLQKEDGNDELRCRWMVHFHEWNVISIQNMQFRGWLTLKKNIKNGAYVLSTVNPKFDAKGAPMVDVENARLFKRIECQFELWPFANCKDQYSDKVKSSGSLKRGNVSFAM